MSPTPSPLQPPTANEWPDRLKLCWTELTQLSGHTLLAEDRVDRFVARLLEVTSHVNGDLSAVVFLGLQMNVTTVAELVLDFVVETPGKALPGKLDVLQLLERCVDRRFYVYFGNVFKVMPSSEENPLTHRQAYEHVHMQAALLEKISENNYYGLVQPTPSFGEIHLGLSVIFGNERECFVQSVVDGNPEFADSVFANYFAAKWLAGHFAQNVAFLKRVFSASRTVARYLFDRILARGCDLHVAALHDDVDGVRRLLEVQGVDADRRDAAGRTALHLAAAREMSPETLKANSEIIDLLLNNSLDIEVDDDLFAGSALLYADMARSWPAIDQLLRCKADTRHLPSTSSSPASAAMLDAIFEHDLDSLMAFCLDKGLSVEHETFSGRLLLRACSEGSHRVVTLLVSRGADINAAEGDDDTPLVLASKCGHLDLVSQLILYAKLAARINASQHALAYVNDIHSGCTALHAAVISNKTDVVAYLIREGSDLWSRDDYSFSTPLHCAARKSPSLAPILINAVEPARRVEYVNADDNWGRTAMHLAAASGRLGLVRLLQKAGARLTARDNDGRTPLMVAADVDSTEIVQHLVDNFDGGVSGLKQDYVNVADEEGITALYLAAECGRVELVRQLHEAGAFVTALDNSGRTPLMAAVVSGCPDVVQYIVSTFVGSERQLALAYINAKDDEGWTALHRAAYYGHVGILSYLAHLGASVDSADNQGKTPLHYAIVRDHRPCASILHATARFRRR